MRMLCWLMLVVFPAASLMAEVRPAMLYASGSVVLNGTQVPRTSAVFGGDRITTNSNSGVTIASQGSAIVVGADSAVVYNGPDLELEKGTTLVTTSTGITAHMGDVSVMPASKAPAKYEITRADGKVLIAAKQGTLMISDGMSSSTLEAGGTTQQPDNDRRRRGAPPPAARQLPGIPSLGKKAAIGLGVSAAVAAGLVAYFTTGSPPLTPDSP